MIIYLAHPIFLYLVDLSTFIKLRNVFLTMTTSVTALFMTAIFRLVHENIYRPSHYHCLCSKSVCSCKNIIFVLKCIYWAIWPHLCQYWNGSSFYGYNFLISNKEKRADMMEVEFFIFLLLCQLKSRYDLDMSPRCDNDLNLMGLKETKILKLNFLQHLC